MSKLLELSTAIDLLQNHFDSSGSADATGTRLRHKRETIDHIGAVIDEIQASLGHLEKTFIDQEAGPDNSTTSPRRRDGAKCFLETAGKVNCSNIIYEDETSWRKSRLQIDMMIKVLKNKIVNLKDIKKHLKDNRPHNVAEYEESIEEDTSDASEITTQRSARKAHKNHQHRHHQQHYNHQETHVDPLLVKSDQNEIPIANRLNNFVLPLNATTTPRTTNRRTNRTYSMSHRRQPNYDEMAAFRAEHQAMFFSTKQPLQHVESTSEVESISPTSSSKPHRGKMVRKPTTTTTTPDVDFSSSTVEPTTTVAISNELSSRKIMVFKNICFKYFPI